MRGIGRSMAMQTTPGPESNAMAENPARKHQAPDLSRRERRLTWRRIHGVRCEIAFPNDRVPCIPGIGERPSENLRRSAHARQIILPYTRFPRSEL